MNRTKKRELPKRGEQPSTYRRIVTGNVNGKSVVQSDEPLLAYEFKTVPGYEHTLMWINPAIPDLRTEQNFDRCPDSVVPGPGGTSLHFVTFPPGSILADERALLLVRPRHRRSDPQRTSGSLRKGRPGNAQNEHSRLCSCL